MIKDLREEISSHRADYVKSSILAGWIDQY